MTKVLFAQWVLLVGFLVPELHAQQDSTRDLYEPKLQFPDKPTLSLLYGPTAPGLRSLNQALARGGVAEIKLGFSESDLKRRFPDVIEYQLTYLSVGRLATSLGKGAGTGEIDTDIWRIAMGWDKGYGYALGSSALTMFHGFGIHWSGLRTNTVAKDTNDAALLSLYEESVRFGTKTEGGLLIQIVPSLSVNLSFERSLILQRHLFWKWAGSLLIEGMSHGLLDKFVSKVMESSPGAAPVVNFVLKNALSYGLYELRRDRMNWPFDTEAPILHDSFRFGLMVVF